MAQIEEEVESLCAAQEINDSKRNTLVAEREVRRQIIIVDITTIFINTTL